MLVLAFTTCLLASPTECQERHLTFVGSPTPWSCMHHGMTELAKWEAQHPKWKIQRGWQCGPADRFGKDA